MTGAEVALAIAVAGGLSLIALGCWLAWGVAAGFMAAGVAVLVLGVLLFMEV